MAACCFRVPHEPLLFAMLITPDTVCLTPLLSSNVLDVLMTNISRITRGRSKRSRIKLNVNVRNAEVPFD